MFEGSLVESTPLLRSRNRWPALASVGVQVTVAAVLIAIPLLHPEVIALGTPHLTLYAPSLPRPVPPPPPARPIHLESLPNSAPTAPTTPAMQQTTLTQGITSTNAPTDAPLLATGLNFSSAQPNLTDAFGSSGPAGPHVVAASTGGGGGTAGKPMPVSTGVLAGMLIEPITAVYPQMAKITRTSGDVIVQAVISRTGYIESARIVSGNAMLQQSALDAVRTARYRPYLLNGQPTEVETTITIHFHLGG